LIKIIFVDCNLIKTILIYKKFNRDLELLTVDAEKAFDTVNHDIMLNKLYHDGITGDMWLSCRVRLTVLHLGVSLV
jgi:hypothetical protein